MKKGEIILGEWHKCFEYKHSIFSLKFACYLHPHLHTHESCWASATHLLRNRKRPRSLWISIVFKLICILSMTKSSTYLWKYSFTWVVEYLSETKICVLKIIFQCEKCHNTAFGVINGGTYPATSQQSACRDGYGKLTITWKVSLKD